MVSVDHSLTPVSVNKHRQVLVTLAVNINRKFFRILQTNLMVNCQITKRDFKDYFLWRPRDSNSVVWGNMTGKSVVVSGTVVEEQQSLMELGVRPHGSTRLEMSSTDPTNHPLRPIRPPEHDNMPDVITVRVQTGMNPPDPGQKSHIAFLN